MPILQGYGVSLPDLVASPNTPLNCFVSGFTQAADTLSVSVYAGEPPAAPPATPPVPAPLALATITGGGSTSMKAMTTGSFTIQPNTTYYAVVTDSTNKQTPQVLYKYDTLGYGTTNYAGTITLAVEDTPIGGDSDFNDALVSITWTLFAS